ncbi:MAG: hypothetical protein LUH18_02045 [Oscillospiraceae bacterium]|nr:hypothetical protein [Oscillospiraceae bacterium]
MKIKTAIFQYVSILVCFFLAVTNVFLIQVNACTNAYYSWTWMDGIDMSNLSASVYTSNYCDVTTVNAMFAWNYISSVIITSINFYDDDDDETFARSDINVYEADLTGTIIGQTLLYTETSSGYSRVSISSTGAIVSQVRIYLDPSLMNTTDEWRAKTLTHEIGHALALKHPILVDCTSQCVMQQNSSGYATSTIQQHDINNLIAKWGY